MLGGRFRDLLVADAAKTHATLGVDAEDHERHLARAVVLGHLRDRRVLRLVAEVAAARFVHFALDLVGQNARRGLGVRMDIDGDQLAEVHAVHQESALKPVCLMSSRHSSASALSSSPSSRGLEDWISRPNCLPNSTTSGCVSAGCKCVAARRTVSGLALPGRKKPYHSRTV